MNNEIAKLKANKTFETNQIFNRMLKMLRKTMTKKLIFIFQACLDVEYYSKLFREAKTIVLKKIKKSDYIFFTINRLIALLNTRNKISKSIMINKITKLTKKSLLLLKITNKRKTRKENRNDAKNVNERNTCNIRTK